MPFPLFLAFKYIRPKRSVASVITFVSIIGVMLGVAVVIIVRSVMTGFGDTWREKVLEFKPHITVMSADSRMLRSGEAMAERFRSVPGIVSATPEIDTRVLVSRADRVAAPVLIGIDADGFEKAYDVGAPVAGSFDLDPDTVVIGRELAFSLGVWAGDVITVCAPPLPNEVFLPRKWKVGGIFSSGHYDYDSGYIVSSLDSARDLMGVEEGVLAVHVKTSCPTDENAFSAIVSSLPLPRGRFRVLTWREADKRLFDAIAVETNLTAVLLLLISIVALFCVMNTLLVLGVQKTPEIGLLKALGFGKAGIMGVFVTHGLIQCTAGVLLGLLASWGVLSNLQNIVEWLASMGMEVFPPAIYNLEEIPHRIVVSDVVYTVSAIYFFGLLASLVPALFAAAKDPVKALDE